MEAVIDQTFGDIVDADVAGFFKGMAINDAFMRDPTVSAGVKNRIVSRQPSGDIIGI